MPQTINGIGSHYYGRKRLVQRHGICAHCGRAGLLSSYDTGLYFVLVFIPLIPLGRKRVIDQCAFCTRHYAMNASAWAAVEARSESAAGQVELAPRDIEAAEEAIQLAVATHQPESLERVLKAVAPYQYADADFALTAGRALLELDRPALALEHLQRAFNLNPTLATRLALAQALLLSGRLDDAWRAVQPALSEAAEVAPVLPLAIAEAQLADGRVDAAATALGELADAIPGLLHDKRFRRLRKAVDRGRLPRGRTVLAARHGLVALWVMVAVILLVVGWQIGRGLYTQQHRTIYLANGLSLPYDVEINGNRLSLTPLAATAIEMPEGTLEVRVLDPELELEPLTVTVSTSLWTSVFKNPAYVVNPDRTALLWYEDIVYAERAADRHGGSARLICGEAFVSFDDVDYPFCAPPESLRTESSRLVRSAISIERDGSAAERYLLLRENNSVEAAESFAARVIRYDVEDELLLRLLDRAGRLQEVAAAAIAARPPRIALHRVLQDAAESEGEHEQLVAEYGALLAQDPNDAGLQYLFARLLPDEEAVPRFERAAAAAPPCTWAFTALGGYELNRGDFSAARRWIDRLLRDDACTDRQLLFAARVLAANGAWGEALSAVHRLRERRLSTEYAEERLYLMVRAGDWTTAGAIAREPGLTRYLGEDAQREARTWLEGVLASTTGDMHAYQAALAQLDSAPARFRLALLKNDLIEASRLLFEQDAGGPELCLLVAMLAEDAGDPERAAVLHSDARRLLGDGDHAERRLAGWLAGDQTPTAEEARDLFLPQPLKPIALVALGRRYPSLQDDCLRLAAKFNFDTRFPHDELERLTRPAMDRAARQEIGRDAPRTATPPARGGSAVGGG